MNRELSYQCKILTCQTLVELGCLSSGIDKIPTARSVLLTSFGFHGDQVMDQRHHGGKDRAALIFPFEYYKALGVPAEKIRPGFFGENVSTIGLSCSNVFIGDVFQLGEAVLEVSQPRSPCFRLNLRASNNGVARLMQEKALCGFFVRVLKPGEVDQGAQLILKDRRVDGISVTDLVQLYYDTEFREVEYQRLLDNPYLSDRWKAVLSKRLASGEIEDWTTRLDGIGIV